jgi:DNA-binding transcriptional regulator YdaS (Cro superfamily)
MSNEHILTRVLVAAGGPSALAAKLGIRAPSIYSWTRIPAGRAAKVEAATGIPRHELRPDLWAPPGVGR